MTPAEAPAIAARATHEIHAITHLRVADPRPGYPDACRFWPIVPRASFAVRRLRSLEAKRDEAYRVIAHALVGTP